MENTGEINQDIQESPKRRRKEKNVIESILTRPKLFLTIIMTTVFAFMVIRGDVTAEQFLMVFSPIIALFFGDKNDDNESRKRN